MGISRNRLTVAGLLCAALLAPVLAQQAVPPTQLKPTGYVDDFAHVLDPGIAAALEQRAADINRLTKVQIAMVTVTTTGDTDAFDYSLALAQHWGVGSKQAANRQDKDTGLLIFIAVQDHHYYTQVGYGLEPYITDADVGAWMRALVPQLRASDFGSVFAGMLDQVQTTLAARMPDVSSELSQLPALETASAESRHRGGNGNPNGGQLAFFAILFIIWIIGAFASRGSSGGLGGCLWPLIFMNMGGGGYRGGGWGGGFGGGGFGGGSGFGGFGGGGFGGGGAGGSW